MVVNEKMKPLLQKMICWIINVLFWLSMLAVAYVCVQVFLLASFKIPSDSMAPALTAGDRALVCKPIVGARLFNLFDAINGERVEIYRLPGLRKVKRNDVVVFNFPYPRSGDKIEMHIMKYYIKRCIGLPGDSLEIQNGFYHLRGVASPLGNVASQQKVSTREKASFDEGVYHTFPHDSAMNWNIKDFGPLYIPKKGDVLPMNRTHFLLYKKLIEWEQNAVLTCKDSVVCLNDRPLASYRFRKDYYFMAGDHTKDSRDSRYWGLLPEEYIVGKAWMIWKSVDPSNGKIRWERVFKLIEN